MNNNTISGKRTKMMKLSKNRSIASILVAVVTLTSVLTEASTVGREHTAFAFQDLKASAYIKDGHGKQRIELPTNVVQNAVCETAGENSPIVASCTNTANVINSNTGGLGTVRGSTSDNRKHASEEPTITGGAVCETAGENSPIVASCTNTANVINSNTGGLGTVRGSTSDNRKHASEEPTITGGAVCETAGKNSPIVASCTNTANVITSNTGGLGTVRGSTSDNRKQATEEPTITGGAVCETAGKNSPIVASCTNTANVITSNTGGLGTVRGSTSDNRKHASEEPTITGGAVCETAGKNSPIVASCTNTANVITSNTGGLGTVRGSTSDNRKQASEEPTITGGAVCETAGKNSPIVASCTNTANVITSNTGGLGTVRGSTSDNRKQASEEPTITGGAVCETAGKNSPIVASCTNTSNVITSNTGGLGTVRGSTSDNRKQASEEPTITGGAVCETAGKNS